MARFATRGRLFNGDSMSAVATGFEAKDPTQYKLINGGGAGGGLRLIDISSIPLPIAPHLHKRKLIVSPNSRILASYSSSSSPSTSSHGNYKYKHLKSKEGSSNVGIDANYEDIFEDDEDQSDDLSCFRGLVLDIAYRPVNVVCWKRAICLEFMDKADVLEYYDQTVNSPSGSFYIPAVLRVPHLLQVIKRRRVNTPLSRRNILSRDNFTCQYCSSKDRLTVDHVLPVSRGGEWTWENLVAACSSCNSKKGHKTLEEVNMKLLKTPKAPKDYEILAIPLTNATIKMLKLRKDMPEEWQQYLSKPSP